MPVSDSLLAGLRLGSAPGQAFNAGLSQRLAAKRLGLLEKELDAKLKQQEKDNEFRDQIRDLVFRQEGEKSVNEQIARRAEAEQAVRSSIATRGLGGVLGDPAALSDPFITPAAQARQRASQAASLGLPQGPAEAASFSIGAGIPPEVLVNMGLIDAAPTEGLSRADAVRNALVGQRARDLRAAGRFPGDRSAVRRGSRIDRILQEKFERQAADELGGNEPAATFRTVGLKDIADAGNEIQSDISKLSLQEFLDTVDPQFIEFLREFGIERGSVQFSDFPFIERDKFAPLGGDIPLLERRRRSGRR